ncbi:unnamed protein product [Kuraishia capsulata CBS 1993]|uniref:Arginase n=1 Tax=Kuraishia capsulata CBS 1993 TaxID=1382522 RepID=W6MRD5_9ASCO|nr:uncharacterized protein KUCA_T00004913001 [Kuraishia capsulata CBS 1993]CDK28928.1 unnamed protein product [Kuraishia capsulata CBS 1993]
MPIKEFTDTETRVNFKFHPDKKTTLVLAPFSGGQGKSGVEDGPEHMLKAGLQKELELLGWDVAISEPLKDLDLDKEKKNAKDVFGKCKRPALVSDSAQKIYKGVREAIQNKTLPLTIGGDHSIGIGTLAGSLAENPETCVLWIDAHADINTPSTTDSGNLHGCPVSFVMGLDRAAWPPQFSWLDSVTTLHPSKIAYIGLRDVDVGERKILRDHGIAAFSMYHVDKYGIAKVVEMALAKVNPSGTNPVHVSYDVDAIDPLYTPATGTPVRGGLTLREGLFIVEAVAETGNLSALDVVETNPALALQDTHALDTVSAGCAIARCALGETLL